MQSKDADIDKISFNFESRYADDVKNVFMIETVLIEGKKFAVAGDSRDLIDNSEVIQVHLGQ